MATKIQVKLNGKAVENGSIELRQLVRFGENFQKAVDRMAYSIEKKKGSTRKLSEVSTDTVLRLTGTQKGSFVAELDLSRPDVLIEGYDDAAIDTLSKLFEGMDYLRNRQNIPNQYLPDGYDQGVLVVLKKLGGMLSQGISSMEFNLDTSSRSIQGIYDSYTHKRVTENISPPEEKIAAITGELLMGSFVEDRYRCHLFVDDKRYSCTFDEDVADDIDAALRHRVNVIGIAEIDAVNEQISTFHIKQIVVLDQGAVDPTELDERLTAYIEENDSLANFKKGWEDMLEGRTHPISELWDGIDAE